MTQSIVVNTDLQGFMAMWLALSLDLLKISLWLWLKLNLELLSYRMNGVLWYFQVSHILSAKSKEAVML